MIGPAPVMTRKLRYVANTNSTTMLTDGAGSEFICYRALKTSAGTPGVVLECHYTDGRVRIVIEGDYDAHYGSPTFVHTPGGYATVTTISRDGKVAAKWHINEDYGWARRMG